MFSALGFALIVQAVGSEISHDHVRTDLIVITSPTHLISGERYAAIAGFRFAEPGNYQTQMRACHESGECTLIWPRALEVAETNGSAWTVVGGQFRLAEVGEHRLEAFVKRKWGPEGYRSIGRHDWSVTVE